MSRPALAAALAAALVFALTACAPDAAAGTQRIEVEGVITAVAASGGSARSYVLDVTGQGVLPLDLGEQVPPPMATGVVVEVPDSIDVPGDTEGRFAALSEYSAHSQRSLRVVAFVP